MLFKTKQVRNIWLLFTSVKFLYMFIAIAVISNMTTLGDTFDYFYLTKPQAGSMPSLLTNSTFLMNITGHNLYLFFGKYIANIPFIFLSIYGIYYPIKKLLLSNKQLLFILVILSFPSFGIWTSICSKESVGVFFMGILLGYIIDLIEKRRKMPNILEWYALYLLFVFKIQYVPAIVALVIFIKLSHILMLKKFGKNILYFIFICLILVVLYIVRDYAQMLADLLPIHFSFDSRSTRENTIWIDQYDIYYNAVEGIYIAFVGPTFEEAMKSKMQFSVLLESYLIIFLFITFIIKTFIKNNLNIYILFLSSIGVFFILFGHYPFGQFNAGSAIRYRENFYAFLVIFLLYMYLKSTKKYANKCKKIRITHQQKDKD